MKITRTIIAAVAILVAGAACTSSPTAPTPGSASFDELPPVIGSGVGGG